MITTGIGHDGEGVTFTDLNGDGRTEYLWIDQYGVVTAIPNLVAQTRVRMLQRLVGYPRELLLPVLELELLERISSLRI